jgi:transcriptional regulator of acetoin/glycerol metabolism
MRLDKKSLVSKSWERSNRYGVDQLTIPEDIVDATELQKYRQANRLFLQEVKPTIHRLCEWLQLQRSVVILANSDGYILESIGDPSFLSDVEKIHLMKGAGWSEEVRGTNAIGTVIAEKKPLSIVGDEHYCLANRILYCSASPIFDPQGNIIGVLDVSGYHKDYHPSLLGMVDVISRQIEDGLLLRDVDRKIIIELSPQNSRNYHALLAFNEEGLITGMNREARYFLDKLSPSNQAELPLELANVKKLLQRGGGAAPNEVIIYQGNNTDEKWVASVYLDKRPTFVGVSKEQRGKIQKSSSGTAGSTVKYTFEHIFGLDPKFKSALSLAKRVATTDYNVLVTGESGTGKEMVSQAIHDASNRHLYPFIAINCGAIPKTLMESELFGYEAGSFTGAANSARPGKIELAHKGTLLLDEIAEMPYDMQVALLRVLQEHTVTRIGGHRPIDIDVRIIAATNKDLFAEVEQGRFRADLYFRLLGIQIVLPPLREREDRLELAHHLLSVISKEIGRGSLNLSSEAKKLIIEYDFPGNVRELAAVLRHAAFLSTTTTLDVNDFPAHMFSTRVKTEKEEIPFTPSSLRKLEYDAILDALNTTNGNITKAARMLGIGRNTLYRKLRAFEPEHLN